MKKAIITILFLGATLFAQPRLQNFDADFRYGVRLGGGIDFSYIHKEKSVFNDTTISRRIRGGESLDIAVFSSIQKSVFALQTEVLFTKYHYPDYRLDYPNQKWEYRNWYYYGRYGLENLEMKYDISRYALIVPFLAKLSFRSNNFFIEGFFGPHFMFDISKFIVKHNGEVNRYTRDELKYGNFPFYRGGSRWVNISSGQGFSGWTLGMAFGVKANSGTLFFDIRFLEETRLFSRYFSWLEESSSSLRTSIFSVHREKISATIGYEFKAIPIKQK